MAQGYVLSYQPDTGQGTIVTDSGREVPFSASLSDTDIHGGDIVSFTLPKRGARNRASQAGEIRIVQRWPDCLKTSYQPLLRELHSALEIEAPSH